MSATSVTPEVTNLKRRKGMAGQFSVEVTVTHPGEEPRIIEFVGSEYGGPVLMVTQYGQTFVTDPGRFGTFGEDWVRKFFQ